ncbi:MAG: penicillin-binding protein 1C [Anaerolineae bacterium]
MRLPRLWSQALRAAGVAALVVAAALAVWGVRALRDLPDVRSVGERTPAPSILIVDRSGRLLYEAINPRVGKHIPVPLEEIPLALRQATIATEDARFGHHPGVDPLALLRALWLNLRSGEVVSGGSTIPQQVARTLLLAEGERSERTLWRKVREAVLAWRLSRTYTPDEILELYLNQTYYGHYARGVEAAAQAYFGKHVGELDLAECALLAGLPQSPTQYNPLENPEAAKVRQRVVLDLMVRRGYITPEEARAAAAEPLHFAAAPFPIQAPHFVMYVQRLLEEQVDPAILAQGGLVVRTTLDLDLNREAERILRRHLERLTAPGGDDPPRRVDNAALVALDPRTGEVLAMVGSPDYFDPRISGAVNGALALRQPGSAIKPLTYAAAFDPARATPERPPLTAATLVEDVLTPFVTREGDPYVPLNYDLQFHGPVLLRQALGSSLNIPAVKVLDYIGVDTLVTLAHDLGIHSLDAGHRYGLALTLGGGEVSLLELTRAYAAFANGGRLPHLRAILRVEDLQGRVVWEPEAAEARPVLDPRVAYLITDILSDNYARLLGFGEASPLRLSRPAAAKTGTTTDWRDNWTLGYVPQLVVGVWVGNADGSPMYGVSGVDGAAPIWHDFMEVALRGQPVLPFVEPPGLVRVRVCAESGLLPGPSCPRQREELFLAGTEPREVCTLHLPSEGAQAAQPAEEAGQPLALAPARAGNAPDAKTTGPERPGISLASPAPNSQYRLSPALPRTHQRIPITVHTSPGLALDEVTILVDGAAFRVLQAPPYEAWWPLEPGEHRVQAVARDRAGRQWETPVVALRVWE